MLRVLPGTRCFICLEEFSEGEVAIACTTCSLRTEIGTSLVLHDVCTKNWTTASCPYCAEPLQVLPWTKRNGESILRALRAFTSVSRVLCGLFLAVHFVVLEFEWAVYIAWYAHSTVLFLGVGCVVVVTVAGLAWALLQRWRQPFYTVGITMGIPFLFVLMDWFKQVMCFCYLCGCLYLCVTQVVMPIIVVAKLKWQCTGNPRIKRAPVLFVGV